MPEFNIKATRTRTITGECELTVEADDENAAEEAAEKKAENPFDEAITWITEGPAWHW